MPSLVKARDACGFFKNTAPAFGFGVDQFGNLSLTDQGWAMGASRGIGKQHLDIAGPRLIAVGLIGRACITGDPTYDIQTV